MTPEEMGLDHPCRETCSGWKQGHDRGIAESSKSAQKHYAEIYDNLTKENAFLKNEIIPRLNGMIEDIKVECERLRNPSDSVVISRVEHERLKELAWRYESLNK